MLIIYPARTKTIRVNGINCIEYIIILSYTPDYTWQKLKDDDPIRVILSHSMRWPRLTNLQTQLTLSCMTIGFQTFYCSHNKNLQLLAGVVLRVSSGRTWGPLKSHRRIAMTKRFRKKKNWDLDPPPLNSHLKNLISTQIFILNFIKTNSPLYTLPACADTGTDCILA